MALALAGARTARAEVEKPGLGFSADEVEADAGMGELVLRGNVVVTDERFRLTSPRLSLRRTARGIEVDGPGEVVFCPCRSPPVSIAFAGGVVGPPADLILRQPELRLGGIALFRLPWFWLRAPSRAGVLPPTLAWRGGDGLLVGGGVHVPWRKDDGGFDEADFTAAAYLRGGVELGARVRTARSTNRVRWDHLDADLLAVDARGVLGGVDDHPTLTWDIDAARGPRARSATLDLREAALGYDQAAGETALRLFDVAVAGVGVRAVAPRGGYGPGTTSAWGPRVTLAAGGAIGGVGVWDGALVGASWATVGDTSLTHVGRTQAGLTLTARPSWFAARIDLRENTTFAGGPDGSGLDALASTRAEVSLPLARAYGRVGDDGDAPLVHTIEPRVAAGLVAIRTTAMPWSDLARPFARDTAGAGRTAIASLGAKSSWGRPFNQAGASVELDAGAVVPLHDASFEPLPVGRMRGAWSGDAWSVAVEGAEALRAATGYVWVSRTRVGAPQGFHFDVHVAGRGGIDPVTARTLMSGTGTEPTGGFLAAEGWSAEGEVGARLGASLTAKVALDEDFTAPTLLQVRGALAYAHPCRCVAVDAYAGQRLGREGVDVWVSIDLAPR